MQILKISVPRTFNFIPSKVSTDLLNTCLVSMLYMFITCMLGWQQTTADFN